MAVYAGHNDNGIYAETGWKVYYFPSLKERRRFIQQDNIHRRALTRYKAMMLADVIYTSNGIRMYDIQRYNK